MLARGGVTYYGAAEFVTSYASAYCVDGLNTSSSGWLGCYTAYANAVSCCYVTSNACLNPFVKVVIIDIFSDMACILAYLSSASAQ